MSRTTGPVQRVGDREAGAPPPTGGPGTAAEGGGDRTTAGGTGGAGATAETDPPGHDPTVYPRPVQARVTVRGVLALQVLANGAGAALVIFFLAVVFPDDGPGAEAREDLNLAVFAGYLAATVLIALPVNRLFLNKAMRWVRDGRRPTDLERWNTLTQPLQQTFSAFLMWLGAGLIFGLVNQGLETAPRVGAGIVLAGLITTSLLYYLLERHFRPVFALALEGATLPRWRREILNRVMLAWIMGSAAPLLAIGLAPLGLSPDQLAEQAWRLALVAVAGVIGGGLVMRAAAGAVSRPIDEVTDALAEVEEGDLDVHLAVTNVGELGRLQAGFNAMAHGLQERERLKDLFGRQVGTDVARAALDRDPELGGEAREVTALFIDLAQFTAYTETHTPEEVVAELNRFFAVVIREVMREGGWVNKFEGDAALCLWGAPGDQPDHAARALRAAARLPAAVAGLPDAPRVGIGVATGRAVAGNVGTAERYEYTVIGDAVNLASRLTDVAKERRVEVLATGATVAAAGEAAGRWREIDTITVRGRTTPTAIFAPA